MGDKRLRMRTYIVIFLLVILKIREWTFFVLIVVKPNTLTIMLLELILFCPKGVKTFAHQCIVYSLVKVKR